MARGHDHERFNPHKHQAPFSRRHGGRSRGVPRASLFNVPGLFAQALTLAEVQSEGPFYPPDLPLDTDNDLLIINDAITPVVGEITHLSGRILDATGDPIRNTLVEIWQVDSKGVYLHPEHGESYGGNFRAGGDKNFQGFGRFMTGSTGEHYFRTVKPVPYPDSEGEYRQPHIHFAIKMKGREKWTTQAYSKGEP